MAKLGGPMMSLQQQWEKERDFLQNHEAKYVPPDFPAVEVEAKGPPMEFADAPKLSPLLEEVLAQGTTTERTTKTAWEELQDQRDRDLLPERPTELCQVCFDPRCNTPNVLFTPKGS